MYLNYGSALIRKICTDEKAARKHLPQEAIRKLFRRLQELAAFKCLADIPPSPPFYRHKLKGARTGQWAVTIHGSLRICFRPDITGDQPPTSQMDLRTIESITITFIGDYH